MRPHGRSVHHSASTALILVQARPGLPAAAILAEVLRIRAQAWPNLRVVEMGDAMLGRGGALVAAAHRVYRHQLEVRPHLAGLMEEGGRGREVAAARAADAAPLAAG